MKCRLCNVPKSNDQIKTAERRSMKKITSKVKMKAPARKGVSKKKQIARKVSAEKPATKAMKPAKKPTRKATLKRITKRATAKRLYRMPKTAAEHGITCLAIVAGATCGKPVVWFDYELGEKEFYKGFVCDRHKVSNRIEKLAQPQVVAAAV